MRILKEGKVTEYKAVCGKCGTEFAYVDKDTVLPGFHVYYVECPLCGNPVKADFNVLIEEEQ